MVIKRLIWEEWNIAHIARHNVKPEEVDQACHGKTVVQTGKKGRVLVYGLTQLDRMITVVLDAEPEEGVYYPVTARTSSKKERTIYRKEVNEND